MICDLREINSLNEKKHELLIEQFNLKDKQKIEKINI